MTPAQIYLDYNASTPIAPEVAAAMRPLLDMGFGNPSSDHWAGRPAREAVDAARNDIATLLGCETGEVVLTSGGSEANNHVIKGMLAGRNPTCTHVVTSAIEHPAILEPCRYLKQLGARVTIVGVDHHGLVDPADIKAALTPETVLVSIMHANNEVGTIQPIAEIAAIAHAHGALCHTDAAQSVGKIPTRVDELGVDLLSLAGHKLYAPKGVGALFIRRAISLPPLIAGGGHEQGRRAGTESALLASGLGAACRLATTAPCHEHLRTLRDRFWDALATQFGNRMVLNGHPERRLPNTLNVAFPGQSGPDLLARLDGVAASTGSACHTGAVTMSPVLTAMRLDPELGRGAIRFSLGRQTTAAEIDATVARLEAQL